MVGVIPETIRKLFTLINESLAVMKIKILWLLAGLTFGFMSCRKSEPNPCEGLLYSISSNPILIKFVDVKSKKTIILKEGEFKITNNQTKQILKNWEIYNNVNIPVSDTTLASKLTGSLIIPTTVSSAGEYGLTIESDSLGTFLISFTATEVKTNEPCVPYTYPLKDVKITNRAFSVFQHSGKTYPEVLVVEI